MTRPLLFSLLTLTLVTSASAGVVDIDASGMFSASDTADSLVVPGGTFNLSFAVDSNPVLAPSNFTLNSFEVPVSDFTYSVNNVPVSVTPDSITFFTSGLGGGFEVDFTAPAADFIFQGDQMFSGPTSAPVFSPADFSETWNLLDASNVDAGSGPVSAAPGQVSSAPEPSSLALLLFGGIAVFAVIRLGRFPRFC